MGVPAIEVKRSLTSILDIISFYGKNGGVLNVMKSETGEFYAVLKQYRDRYKLVLINGPRQGGNTKIGSLTYEQKLENSISRARQKIYEYAYCNDWDYFFTGTLDQKKYNRQDLPKFHKDLCRWFYDYRRKTGQKISFLLIPEPHKDGAWHMHGLLSGIPSDRTEEFKKGTALYRNKDGYVNWPDYAKKFGFVSLGAVRSAEAVSSYITKYITKSIAALSKQLGAHLYYCSRGLATAQVIKKRDILLSGDFSFDYENDFCGCRWYDDLESANRVFLADEFIQAELQKFLDECEDIEV